MKPIRNASPVSPEVLDRARRMAWLMYRKGKDYVPMPHLGSGCFSHVFDLGDGLVLKVGGPGGYGYKDERRHPEESVHFMDSYNGGPQDDAWPQFVMWTASMKRRPTWAPRVHHMETLSGRVYFAVCEKLERNATRRTIQVRIPIHIVRQVASKRGLRNDMHVDNFMRRPHTGALVINDPWIPSDKTSYGG